jgi:hypothetical protein
VVFLETDYSPIGVGGFVGLVISIDGSTMQRVLVDNDVFGVHDAYTWVLITCIKQLNHSTNIH